MSITDRRYRGSNQYVAHGRQVPSDRRATAAVSAVFDDQWERWDTPLGTFDLFDQYAGEMGQTTGDRRSVTALRFSWSVPTVEAIRTCVEAGPLVEVGAGSGYCAKLITDAGGDIVSFDRYPPGSRVLPGDPGWYRQSKPWPPVHQGWSEAAAGGQRIVYVGEGHGGGCGDPKMWAILGDAEPCHACTSDDDGMPHECEPDIQAQWEVAQRAALPRWTALSVGFHDSMTAFTWPGGEN